LFIAFDETSAEIGCSQKKGSYSSSATIGPIMQPRCAAATRFGAKYAKNATIPLRVTVRPASGAFVEGPPRRQTGERRKRRSEMADDRISNWAVGSRSCRASY
jgi:hypothetical protein